MEVRQSQNEAIARFGSPVFEYRAIGARYYADGWGSEEVLYAAWSAGGQMGEDDVRSLRITDIPSIGGALARHGMEDVGRIETTGNSARAPRRTC